MTRPLGHSTPRALRERPARRLAGDLVVLAFLLVFYHYYVPRSIDAIGVQGVLRPVLSVAAVAILALPYALLFTASHSTDYSLARVRRPALVATLCALSSACAVATVLPTVRPVPTTLYSPPGYVFGAFVLALVWIGVLAYARRSRKVPLHRLVRIKDPGDAAELVARCRQALRDDWLRGNRRAAVELNLASALIALSARGDQDDGLGEADAILRGSLASKHPVWMFAATSRLVEAMTTKVRRRGELDDYDSALALLHSAVAAAQPAMPDARARALATLASSRMVLSEHAARDGELARAAELHAQARADAQRAVELAPAHSSLRALHRIALARIEGPRADADDLDRAIETCRSALRRLSLSSATDRATGYHALADLLALRAAVRPATAPGPWWRDPATNDRLRALGLCLWLCFAVEHAPQARVRIAALMRDLRKSGLTWLPGSSDEDMGRLWGILFAERAADSVDGVAELAEAWAAWASEQEDVASTAEAHSRWLRAVVAESRGRVMERKEHALRRMQELAGESADWLLRAGRPRDAAVALDVARAVLLTERMHRARDGLEQRLLAAGHADVAARWRDACARISEFEQETFSGERPERRHAAGDTRFVSDEYAALADHERLLREIASIPGCEDVDAPTTYEDLRRAACEGPLVYVAAAARRGFAIVVRQTGEPEVVELAALTAERVDAVSRRLGEVHEAWQILVTLDAAELFGADGRDFSGSVIARVTRDLARDAFVTLIPTGALGQMPLHVTGLAEDVTSGRGDLPVLRYAPNARVLLRAQQTAAKLGSGDSRVLTAGVGHAPGLRALASAEEESRGVAALFDDVARPFPADVDRVLAALGRCTVWHFACHGSHDPAEPLDSVLVLADGTLSLRMIFARDSASHRLAVLSACQTAFPGGLLPNEVVNFPSALLQAGVAGVICCHGDVDDGATTMLMLAFFARFRAGAHPARALADAQAWLRDASGADLRVAFPDACAAVAGEGFSDAGYPFSGPECWAMFSYWGA